MAVTESSPSMLLFPKGACALIVVAFAAILAASHQCPEPVSDSVSFIQSRLSVTTQRSSQITAVGAPMLEQKLQYSELNAAAPDSAIQDLDSRADASDSVAAHSAKKPVLIGHTSDSQAWWTQSLFPWLSWHMPVSLCLVMVAAFSVSQLIAIGSLQSPRSDLQALPAGEAAVAKDRREEKGDHKDPSLVPSSAWAWLALSWANPVFNAESQTYKGLNEIHPDDDADVAHARLQTCWAQEVAQCKGVHDVRLLQVLWRFIGSSDIFLLSGLVMTSFAVNCIGMVVSVEFLLGYVEWLQAERDEFGATDPLWSSLLVLALCFVMPLAGIAIEESLKVKDARINARLASALTVEVCRKVQRLPPASPQHGDLASSASAQQLIADIAETSTNATRLAIQCFTAPFHMVLLLALLWSRVGLSTAVVVIGFVPLMFMTRAFLGSIVPARVAHRIAHEKWSILLRNVCDTIVTVKACGWEAPLMKRISEARCEDLDAMWTMHNVGQNIVTFSLAWPRLVIFAVLINYYLVNPFVDGISLFTCLQVLGYITYLMSAGSLGSAKCKAILPLAARAEAFLNQPEGPACHLERIASEKIDPDGVCLQGSFSWRAKDEPVLRDLDLKLPNGTLAAIVGGPGSGKTSVLHAAMGALYHQSEYGVALSCDGVKTAAYCAQKPWIFGDTLRENIVLGAPHVDEDRYAAALRIAGLTQDIETLPDGETTALTSEGSILSASQRARVSFARCAYSFKKLVLVDDMASSLYEEPSAASHVDAALQRLVDDPILKDRTRMIATSPNSALLERCDVIIVMESGQIVEKGSLAEVSQTEAFQRLQGSSDAKPSKQKSVRAEQQNARCRSIEKHPIQLLREKEPVCSNSFEALLRCLKLAGWPRVVKFASLVFASQLVMLLMDVSLATWANEAETTYEFRGDGKPQKCTCLWFYLAALIISISLAVASNYLSASCSRDFSEGMHAKLLHAVLSMRWFSDSDHQHNKFADSILSDLYRADFATWGKISGLVSMLCAVACPLAYIHAVSPAHFTLVSLPCYIAMGVFISAYCKTLPKLQRQSAQQSHRLQGHLHEATVGATSRRAFGQLDGFEIKLTNIINECTHARLMATCISSQWLLIRLGACFVPIFVFAALNGTLNPGTLSQGSFGLMLVFCISIFQSFELNAENIAALQQELAVAERFQQVTGPHGSAQVSKDSDMALFEDSPAPLCEDVMTFPEGSRSVSVHIKSLCVGYQGLDVLRGISLQIDHGQKVGIFGAAKSGKSSLLLAILRLVSPKHGTIMLNEKDASKMNIEQLRAAVGLVPQNPILFQADISFNLDPLEKHSAEDIGSALHAVGLGSLAQDLKREWPLEESIGPSFCSGLGLRERRLLTIARMILCKPALLLLDDALLGLEARSQAKVQSTLQTAFSEATILSVAREREGLIAAERVFELKQGVLIERD